MLTEILMNLLLTFGIIGATLGIVQLIMVVFFLYKTWRGD